MTLLASMLVRVAILLCLLCKESVYHTYKMKGNKPATLNAGRLLCDHFRCILIHWLGVGELLGRHCP